MIGIYIGSSDWNLADTKIINSELFTLYFKVHIFWVLKMSYLFDHDHLQEV